MKKRCLCLTIITVVFLGALPAFGMNCEVPPFINRTVTPNVLIIMDNSGSMRGGPPEPDNDQWFPYDANRTYTPWVGMPDKGSNWNNYSWYHRNRWCVSKHVMTHFLNDTEGIRFGLMRMDGAGDGKDGYWWGHDDWGIPNPGDVPYATWEGQHKGPPPWQQFEVPRRFRHGGKLLRPVGTDKNALINYINGMEIYMTVPHTYTILAETLYTAAQYFAAGHGPPGMTTYKSDAAITDWQYGGKYWASRTDDYGNGIDTSSPIGDWCQKNFVIFLTDGLSNFDSDWDELLAVVGDYDGDGRDDPHHDGHDEGENHNYFDDVAQWMYETDLRDDIPNKEEWVNGVKKIVQQNVTTYVIGFTLDKPLLKQAAEQGGGKYFTANDYDGLRAAFENIKNDIIGRVASASAVAVQSTSTEGLKRLLRAKFVPTEWMGHLEAFKLPYTPGDQAVWDGGIKLRDKDPVDRYIFTALDSKGGAGVAMNTKVLFTEANSETEDVDGDALWELLGAANDDEADKIIRYIRGTSVNGYRVRKDGWKLGDIAYSSPIISGNTVYVGANDGMLHAFDINTGEEKWAFIPNNLLGKLKDLTRNDYCHEYFVDLSPRVAEMFVGGVYKKVLVGGERGGGKAFFALDITQAQDPALVQPMWEFSDPALGESWTIPTVERFWIAGAERWLALVGSGWDNADSKGYLLAVDVMTGLKLGKQRCIADAPENVLPSLRAVDFNQDGFTDKIYMGSLTGSLFIVEVAKDAAADTSGKGWTDKHILTTQNIGGKNQPISTPTSLSLYREGGATNVMVYFGTGRYFELADKDNKQLQSFYAVKDNAVKVGIGGLADQTDAFTCESMQDRFGWFMDLVEGPGERVISTALVIGGYVFFATFQPDDDPCVAGGIARLYCINYDNGCVPAAPVIDINGDGVVDEGDNVGGTVPRTIIIGHGVPSDIVFNPDESTIIIQTSDTTIHQFKVDVMSKKLTVHSWREVIN